MLFFVLAATNLNADIPGDGTVLFYCCPTGDYTGYPVDDYDPNFVSSVNLDLMDYVVFFVGLDLIDYVVFFVNLDRPERVLDDYFEFGDYFVLIVNDNRLCLVHDVDIGVHRPAIDEGDAQIPSMSFVVYSTVVAICTIVTVSSARLFNAKPNLAGNQVPVATTSRWVASPCSWNLGCLRISQHCGGPSRIPNDRWWSGYVAGPGNCMFNAFMKKLAFRYLRLCRYRSLLVMSYLTVPVLVEELLPVDEANGVVAVIRIVNRMTPALAWAGYLVAAARGAGEHVMVVVGLRQSLQHL
ncbi:unnamed protein product [Symbiodinium microadriaticum]|nr:unnamed protein product [Symbiodinium sp. KB8]CAE7345621.1 unnamed protein product [Symbiodinium microadriaticum]